MVEERAYWLTWAQIPGIGPILIRRLQSHFGTLSAAWVAEPSDLRTVEGFGTQTIDVILQERRRLDPESFLQQHMRSNPDFWTPADADYPQLLLEIPDPPPVLYYKGRMEPLENQGITPAIAMVGTRRPSDYGRRWARKLSIALAQAGFTVVSGLAEGIDTEAHHSCLGVEGRTIAVLGTGVDVIYPAFNLELAKHIVHQGLLLSEYPAGTQPERVNFPRRNRIIAGLARATLVVEAPVKSGSLITARLANEYGREVYALPGSLDNSRVRGCLELLNQGASLILGEQELLKALGELPSLQWASQRSNASTQQLSLLPELPPHPPIQLEPHLQTVLQAVSLDPVNLDRIVQQAGLETGAILSALSQLELMGFVTQLPGMRYQRG
ncbi:DNA-processing protein DprA [Egbenema bharatensis]|uniref:DNA-processing protein DprA n=1 Tax=Egbenema bharatensis TaxID=3463334 RepID=UPI003A89A9D4